jgi:hypothetical protein
MLARSIPGAESGRPRRIMLAVAILVPALAASLHVQRAGAGTGQPAATSQAAMSLAGSIWIGDQPAPAGTILVARIGETVCGVTLVAQPTPGLNYRLTVLSAGTRPGCGTDRAPITLLVGGVVAGARGGRLPPFAGGGARVVDLVVP